MHQQQLPRLLTLPDGLRLLIIPAQTRTAHAGILVGAGTRHQDDDQSGMAHLVEHMTFKGTRRRTATQIINRIEGVGGELNAYTGKEETVYYTTCLAEHLPRAIDLLRDIVFDSTFPPEELAREVEVVCDEIESYEDSPAELIFDDFEALLFPNMPLGRNILGDATRLRQYTTADLKAFTTHHYRPDNALLFILAPEAALPRALLREANPTLTATTATVTLTAPAVTLTAPAVTTPTATSTLTDPAAPTLRAATPAEVLGEARIRAQIPSATHPACPGELPNSPRQSSILPAPTIIHRATHQAHVVLGARAFPMADTRHTALTLLTNILGGPGMNSRLNMALRERRGLVYTVESAITAYSDTSVWTTYFGCDSHDVGRCLRLVANELRRLTETPLTPRQLDAAKRQLCAQLTIAWENHESQAIAIAKRLQATGRIHTLDTITADIRGLTPTDIMLTARQIFNPEAMKTLVYDN